MMAASFTLRSSEHAFKKQWQRLRWAGSSEYAFKEQWRHSHWAGSSTGLWVAAAVSSTRLSVQREYALKKTMAASFALGR